MEKVLKRLNNMFFPDVCPACTEHLRQTPDGLCETCAAEIRPMPDRRCPLCGGAVDGVLEICGECATHAHPRPWDHAVSVFFFGGLVRELVHRYKYGRHTCVAPYFAGHMHDSWHKYGSGRPDMVVSVPLHWRKQLVRGYNQSDLLAAEFCRRTGFCHARPLRRRKHTRQQAGLNLKQRAKNMKSVFSYRWTAKLDELHILLIDDVLTTGATLAAATDELKANGAAKVSVLTVARG